MINYKDIHKSIVKRIKTKYPKTSFSTDIEKAIKRHSFFVDLDNITPQDFMREARDINITARIYYFPTTKEDNQIELLEMQDSLMELFLENNLVEVNEDVKFEIDEIELNIVDKVLHCYFDIRISENYNRVDNTELMENLEYD